MPLRITTDLIDGARETVTQLATGWAPSLADVHYADVRLDAVESRVAAAENGGPKFAGTEQAATVGVRVLAGRRAVAPGYAGRALGIQDLTRLDAVIRDLLARAHRRAHASAAAKAEARQRHGALGRALWDTRLAPVATTRAVVPATYRLDPREVPLDGMVRFTTDLARELAGSSPHLAFTSIAAQTELARELFCSSEGTTIDQSFAHTQGFLYVVATAGATSQEHYDVLGHQRGWEILTDGAADPPLELPDFPTFARRLTREAIGLAQAPVLPSTDEEVVVVTDPHYNALIAHEVIGHPAELDRALKMEAAYAGRSWLLRSLAGTEVGEPIASPLVSAFSDPSLPGYGHYRYDHEGTPGRRVIHIDQGIFRGFSNSRQTAAILGVEPNGHFKATEAALVPLIRMSSTVLAPGPDDPGAILRSVAHGYYLVGHRIPSIAESRENFRISARGVYEIRNGEPGRLYRDGGIVADTKDYLMKVDAVGADLRLYPIPNCGKGQPMQTKRLGNGGPTMRSRARLAGGR
jgi:TldD protein